MSLASAKLGLWIQYSVDWRYLSSSYSSEASPVPTASRNTRGKPICFLKRAELIYSNYFVAMRKPSCLLKHIKIESALVSKPRRPARPTICLYSAVVSSLPIVLWDVIITLLAGRLTPAARVVVQNITFNRPSLKRYSAISRS